MLLANEHGEPDFAQRRACVAPTDAADCNLWRAFHGLEL
jgi:hypothetical protein